MRASELVTENTEQRLVAAVMNVIEFLRARDLNKGITSPHATAAVINMIKNTTSNQYFDYALLDQLKSQHTKISNSIKTMDATSISFVSDSNDTENTADTVGNAKDPANVVNAMAKRAAANRS